VSRAFSRALSRASPSRSMTPPLERNALRTCRKETGSTKEDELADAAEDVEAVNEVVDPEATTRRATRRGIKGGKADNIAV
jgi:hypothetical protein